MLTPLRIPSGRFLFLFIDHQQARLVKSGIEQFDADYLQHVVSVDVWVPTKMILLANSNPLFGTTEKPG